LQLVFFYDLIDLFGLIEREEALIITFEEVERVEVTVAWNETAAWNQATSR
jgi:hypothetical protein